MKIGSTDIPLAYAGTTEIKKVFKGTTLIFEKDTGGGGGGGGAGAYSISLVSDDSGGSYSLKAVIQLTTLPSGATGYKIEMAGTQVAGNVSFTGVLIYIPSPANNTTYYANGGSPSSTGGQNINCRAKYIDSSKRLELRMPSDNGLSSGTVKVTAIDSSNTEVGTESSALSIVIAEDG